MTLGEQIRAAREGKNLSQEELAEYMGVSRQAVSKWENNTAVPHGANLERLAEFLGLELPQAEASPQKHNVSAWIGWGVAAILLIFIGVTWIYQKEPVQDHSNMEPVAPQENANTEPALQSVLFYNDRQEEVLPEDNWYNTAEIASILIQWTGDTQPTRIRMFCTPTGTETSELTELLETKNFDSGGNAALLSADSLHRDSLLGHLHFELYFDKDHTVTSDLYNVIYEPAARTILAYIWSFDGQQLVYDPVEWITFPSDRAEELGIRDSGSGFYIYNAQDTCEQLPVMTEIFTVLNWDANYVPMIVSTDEFLDLLEDRTGIRTPYNLTIDHDRAIIEIRECYVP